MSDILQLIVREDLAEGADCSIYGQRELVPWDSKISAFQARRALKAGEIIAYDPGNAFNEDLITIVRHVTMKTVWLPINRLNR
jgi:hypothetical protein